MMTDRELLERAAKAAGITVKWGEKFQIGNCDVDLTDLLFVHGEDAVWNPLDDDSDAFRLAVDLGIQIHFEGDMMSDAVWANQVMIWMDDQDKHAATRRAITRAAAAIGEQK